MAAHQHRIRAVTIGVGAAFDYHAGTIQRAPLWMQRNGLEWFSRLCSDPRRLWKRYLVTNTLFVIGASVQLAQHAWRNANLPQFASRNAFLKFGKNKGDIAPAK